MRPYSQLNKLKKNQSASTASVKKVKKRNSDSRWSNNKPPKNKTPKVSVLMPVYKPKESYLRAAIESILNQVYTDFEFLILDDCPENPRESIVKSYKDKRIKYFKNKTNLGIALSRNKLIELAKGEYLATFDHDDISLPERLLRQVQYLDAHPKVGVVGCKVRTIIKKKNSKYPSNDHDIKLALMQSCAIHHPSSMIRKKVLEETALRYDKEFTPAEDYMLWCRLIPYTNFHNINEEVLVYYRDHSENVVHKQAEEMYQTSLAIWAFNKTVNSALYNAFLLQANQTKRIRLFGILPLLKIVKKNNRIKVYLFEKILLFSKKTTIKLQEA